MESPKLFISYSWSSPEHEQWVLKLATELRENGVNVILDKWDLKEGQDADAFMEKMVTDENVKKVVMICDKTYATKADKREGGVGTEAQIISRKIYEKTDQDKFVAVVVEKDERGKPFIPIYYQSRIYIDLSDNNAFIKNFEQLLRWVFDKPLYIKPDLGGLPTFLNEKVGVSLATATAFRRALNAIKNGEEHASGAAGDYFDVFSSNLELFRIKRDENDKRDFDELVLENINQFLPYRDEAVEIFSSLAKYRQEERTFKQIHKFFEKILPYTEMTDGGSSYSSTEFDNFKFIIHELFLYCNASLLKNDCFAGVAYLLNHLYYFSNPRRNESMHNFVDFFLPTGSFQHRNNRLGLRRLSLQADFLKERAGVLDITFNQIMQVDFLLYLRSVLDALRKPNENLWKWWPITLVYAGYREKPFEIFSRAQEKEYYQSLCVMLGVEDSKEFIILAEGFNTGKIEIPRFGGWSHWNPLVLMNYNQLAKDQ